MFWLNCRSTSISTLFLNDNDKIPLINFNTCTTDKEMFIFYFSCNCTNVTSNLTITEFDKNLAHISRACFRSRRKWHKKKNKKYDKQWFFTGCHHEHRCIGFLNSFLSRIVTKDEIAFPYHLFRDFFDSFHDFPRNCTLYVQKAFVRIYKIKFTRDLVRISFLIIKSEFCILSKIFISNKIHLIVASVKKILLIINLLEKRFKIFDTRRKILSLVIFIFFFFFMWCMI